jgi:sporulation protein YlmC with PRC-barrel domain
MDTTRETTSLIAVDKVQGTKVYNTVGEKLGSIDVMIDKKSGNVAYSVMSFGGWVRGTNIIRSRSLC